VSGKSKEELFEMDMEITNQGLAEFDDKIAALEDSITKAEAKVEVLKGQKDAIKNKKDVSLGQGQVVQQKL
jgi:phage shock protein A